MPAGQDLIPVGLLRNLHFALRTLVASHGSFWNITPTVLYIPMSSCAVGLELVWKRYCYYDLTCRSFLYMHICVIKAHLSQQANCDGIGVLTLP